MCCRIRPLSSNELNKGSEAAVEFLDETEVAVLRAEATPQSWETYSFDQVWGPASSQEQVFDQVEALALSVVDGFNACICACKQLILLFFLPFLSGQSHFAPLPTAFT